MSTRDSVTAAHYVGVHIIRVRSSLCVLPQSLRPMLVSLRETVPSCGQMERSTYTTLYVLKMNVSNHATLIESTSHNLGGNLHLQFTTDTPRQPPRNEALVNTQYVVTCHANRTLLVEPNLQKTINQSSFIIHSPTIPLYCRLSTVVKIWRFLLSGCCWTRLDKLEYSLNTRWI